MFLQCTGMLDGHIKGLVRAERSVLPAVRADPGHVGTQVWTASNGGCHCLFAGITQAADRIERWI